MTQEEFKNEEKALSIQYEESRKELFKKFALANNPYKIGDIITDHTGTIRIERIQTHKGYSDYPSCLYHGTQLNKKDLSVAKRQNHTSIFQQNIVKKP